MKIKNAVVSIRSQICSLVYSRLRHRHRNRGVNGQTLDFPDLNPTKATLVID